MMSSYSAHSHSASSIPASVAISDYISLLKPRVMFLVVFTALCGLLLAPGEIHPLIASVAILSIALGSGAAGAINMWYERDLDAKMKRTSKRPLPAGRMTPDGAIEFAVFLAFASVFMMAFAVNLAAAALLLLAILFYVFVYTVWLKPRTPQNIVIGGAAGAIPPMIGWASVTGGVSFESIMLFLIIFLWTPPHFWALALYKSDDYAKAGIPMLPVVAGNDATRLQILLYSVLLVASSVVPYFIGMSGLFYFTAAVLLGGYFLYLASLLYRSYSEALARKLFFYSIFYLFLLFLMMVFDQVLFYAA